MTDLQIYMMWFFGMGMMICAFGWISEKQKSQMWKDAYLQSQEDLQKMWKFLDDVAKELEKREINLDKF